MQVGRSELSKEINIVQMVQNQRFFAAAMKHLLSKDLQKKLRQETKYKLIVSSEEKGAVLSPRSPLDNTSEPLNIDLEISK